MKASGGLRLHLTVFSLLFAAGMWMSKVAQPLYFDGHGAMIAFGAGYAAMALVGGLSFVWGYLADRIGGLSAVRVGGLIYAVGISGRIFTDLVPSIIFSVIAGAGASLVLVGIRPWVRSQAMDDEIPKVVASRSLGSQAGTFAGTLGAALIFTIAGQAEQGQRAALLMAPVLVLCGIVWTVFAGRSSQYIENENNNDREQNRNTRILIIKLAVLGCLSGFYVSLVAPYVPVILSDIGLADAGVAIVISVVSLTQIGATAVLTKIGTSPLPFRLFIISEIATAVFTLLAVGFLRLSGPLVATIFVVRSAFLALAATAEETIQYALIPAAAAGFVFGISQTAFLAGDAAGGALGAILWSSTGPWGLLVTAGVATLANAVLFPLLLGRKKLASV